MATKACRLKAVKVNGREAKPSHPLKIGDILEIDLATVYLKVRVEALPGGNVKKGEAHTLYTLLEERRKDWKDQSLE